MGIEAVLAAHGISGTAANSRLAGPLLTAVTAGTNMSVGTAPTGVGSQSVSLVAAPTSLTSVGLTSGTPSTTAGTLSQQSNTLYMGNGTAAVEVGATPSNATPTVPGLVEVPQTPASGAPVAVMTNPASTTTPQTVTGVLNATQLQYGGNDVIALIMALGA